MRVLISVKNIHISNNVLFVFTEISEHLISPYTKITPQPLDTIYIYIIEIHSVNPVGRKLRRKKKLPPTVYLTITWGSRHLSSLITIIKTHDVIYI